ncbi:MAG: TetR/AcrR family transcriptional regulator [Dehalococcoidales bacterium]|nr:MAG: TetR/AcrR family transcriptional regulator [Dehalococcoidales bacterium]
MPKVKSSYLKARQEKILEAALDCFAKKGFNEASVDDICQIVGLSHGAIYRYFSSKEDVIEASVQRSREMRAERFENLKQKESAIEAINESMESSINRIEEPEGIRYTRLWVQLFSESLKNERIKEAISITFDDVVDHLEEIIRLGQENGEINPDLDPHILARLFTIFHDGLVVHKVFEPEINISEYAEMMKALCDGSLYVDRKGG